MGCRSNVCLWRLDGLQKNKIICLLNGPFGKNARVTSSDDISFCCFGSLKYYEIHESDKTCYPCRGLTFGGHFLWKKFSFWFDAKHAQTKWFGQNHILIFLLQIISFSNKYRGWCTNLRLALRYTISKESFKHFVKISENWCFDLNLVGAKWKISSEL